ncbi:hypothetical protein O9993_06815 [Vibrio lentus]|nr:hypothetical protein [Vibrio lentus]
MGLSRPCQSDSGAYVSLVLSGKTLSGSDINMQNFSLKTSLNVPMNSARTWWLKILVTTSPRAISM